MLPDVPTVGETVRSYEATNWYGISAPKGVPAGIIDRLSKEIGAGVANSGIRARIDELGDTPFATSSAEFAKLVADDTVKWANVIRAGGIKAE